MEYQVPQFIEIESKVVGPLTLKQFIYLAGSAGLCVTFFLTLPLLFALVCSAPIAALGAALAFYKINGKPLIVIIEAGFNYYVSSKLFLWKRGDPSKKAAPPPVEAPRAHQSGPRLTQGKLSELAWSLDVQNHEREVGSSPQAGGSKKP